MGFISKEKQLLKLLIWDRVQYFIMIVLTSTRQYFCKRPKKAEKVIYIKA